MTPKEKALELVEKFRNVKHTKLSDYSVIYNPTAKVLAKLCVDEILNAIDWHKFEVPNEQLEYWEQVKKEIENL
jgi:hypothetical protein